MRPPCEIVQREFLPRVRSQVAKKLNQQNLSQTEIAERMGLTQAAVSKYLSRSFPESPLDNDASRLADGLSSMMLTESREMDAMVKAICSQCMILRIGASTCNLHRANIPELAEQNCHVCADILGGPNLEFTSRAAVLQDIHASLNQIEDDVNFHRIMPQVRANLVACHEEAESISDVVGVPGRITLVNNMARALINPQFGASRHTATILLRIKERWPVIRACLCVSGKEEVIEATRNAGFLVVTHEKSTTDAEEIPSQVLTSPTEGQELLALHVPGGVGVEPILYLFGPNAVRLASLCSEISASV